MNNDDLLDLFAGLAMQGIFARGATINTHEDLAETAYSVAQAMVNEMERRRDRADQSN